MTTQIQKVLKYLGRGNSLTSKQALSRFGIRRLSARVFELREDGYKIASTPVVFRDTGARGVSYSLNKR